MRSVPLDIQIQNALQLANALKVRLSQTAATKETDGSSALEQEAIDDEIAQLVRTLETVRAAGKEIQSQNQALAAECRYYQGLFDLATDGCLITDAKGIIQRANHAAVTLLNHTKETLEGTPFVQFLVDNEQAVFQTYLARLQDRRLTRIKNWEVQVQPIDQQDFPAMLTGVAVLDEEDRLTGLLWQLRDISERKQIEHDLQESRRRLQALFDHTQDAILLANDQAEYVDVNPAACTLLGYRREELLCLKLWDLTPATNLETGQKLWKEFNRCGSLAGEYEMQRKDKTKIIADFRAVANIIPGLHLSVLRDITKRKQAEKEILDQRDRAKALANVSDIFAQSGLDAKDVWHQIVRHAAKQIGDVCVMTLLSDDGQWLTPCAYYHADPEVLDFVHSLLASDPSRVASSLPGQVVRTGKALCISEIPQEQIMTRIESKNRPFIKKVGIHSLLIVPLRAQDRIIGTLGLSRDTPGSPYTADQQLFLQQIADRAALFIENARLFEEVKQQSTHLRALTRRLAEVQEVERAALARELHDQIGQNLTGLDLNLTIIQGQLATVSDPARPFIQPRLDDSLTLVEEMGERIRNLMSELMPPVLDDYGLVAALQWYGRKVASRMGFTITVRGKEPATRLAASTEQALFRITQEALTNVARHARAKAVTITVEADDSKVCLVIADNGHGFIASDIGQKTARPRWGIMMMAERAKAIGGRCRIESTPGQGTRVVVQVPLVTVS